LWQTKKSKGKKLAKVSKQKIKRKKANEKKQTKKQQNVTLEAQQHSPFHRKHAKSN